MGNEIERDAPQHGERRLNKLAAASAVTAIAGAGFLVFALNPSSSVAKPTAPTKVYICKYVGTPGVNETLQTGQNPIDTSVNAVKEDPIVVGSFFNDQQGRSYVLAFDTGQPKPPRSACPNSGGSSSSPPVSSSSFGISASESSNPATTTATVTEAGPSSAGAAPTGAAAGLHTPVTGNSAIGAALMALGLGGLLTAMRPWKRGTH